MPRGATFADAAAGPPTPPSGTPAPGMPPRGTPRPFGPGPYTPPHGTPGPVTAAGMPTASARAWAPIPPAPPVGSPGGPYPGGPGDPSAPQGGSGGRQVRVLAVITAIVVLLAAAVTVVVLQPWKDDSGANVADSPGSPTGRTDPTGGKGPATQPARPGDSGNPSDNASASSGSSPSASASPSASGSPAGDARTQAAALSGMLDHSGASRQSVINAVNNAAACTSLATAVTDLSRAADSRNAQVTELDTLKFDALPEAAPALDQLRTAWRESASADAHYAAWAQAQADNGCGAGQASKDAGDTASGRATAAKQAFVQAWNGIATRFELPTRTELAI